MAQEMSDKAGQADARSQETVRLMGQIERTACRKFTPEEKIRVMLDGFRHQAPAGATCCLGERSERGNGSRTWTTHHAS